MQKNKRVKSTFQLESLQRLNYVVLSCDCILAQVQSFQRVHCYTPNWIMGKTMATTECRSVTGAIKELTTVQKTTKNNNNNELTEAGRQQTHTGTSAVVRAHNNKNTLLYNLATTTRDMGKGSSR